MSNQLRWCPLVWGVKIPTKTQHAAGYDIYTIENNVWLKPHTSHLFATGLGVATPDNMWLMIFDRGSTGSKGLHVHCGVVDEDYRGNLFICIKNDNPYPVLISDQKAAGFHRTWYGRKYFVYSPAKAIAQGILVPMQNVESVAIDAQEWARLYNESERKDGKLGSSGK